MKTRLTEAVGKDKAELFHQYSAAAVSAVLREAIQIFGGVDRCRAYWAIAERAGMEHPAWQGPGFERVHQGEGPIAERFSSVYDGLMAQHSFSVLLGADSPQISPAQLVETFKTLQSGERFVIGPVEDGGFYLVGGSQGVPLKVWSAVTYGDWETAEQLSRALSKIAPVKDLTTLFDVDTSEDLLRMRRVLESRKDLLKEQKTLLDWLKTI